MRVRRSFNIVVGGAVELSVCGYSAEVEMRLPEGARSWPALALLLAIMLWREL
jgi:hypothetical protein